MHHFNCNCDFFYCPNQKIRKQQVLSAFFFLCERFTILTFFCTHVSVGCFFFFFLCFKNFGQNVINIDNINKCLLLTSLRWWPTDVKIYITAWLQRIRFLYWLKGICHWDDFYVPSLKLEWNEKNNIVT